MVYCQAFGCTNRPDKDKSQSVKRSYFVIPNPKKEKERCERWLHNIGTGRNVKDFKYNQNNVICSDHFHPKCIKEDLMAKTLGYEPKKVLLVPGAVPTIFGYKVFDVINMNGESITLSDRSTAVSQRKDVVTQAEVVQELLTAQDETAISKTDECCHHEQTVENENENENAGDYMIPSTSSDHNTDIHLQPQSSSPLIDRSMEYLNVSVETEDDLFLDTSKNDPSYNPLNDVSDISQPPNDTHNPTVDEPLSYSGLQREDKYIVSDGQLDILLNKIPCRECGAPTKKPEKKKEGTCVRVKLYCTDCNTRVLNWKSQPTIGKMPVFNILLAAAIIFAGSTFQTFKKCAQFSGLNFLSKETFFRIQRNLVVPCIKKLYDKCINDARSEVKDDGKSAKYCTYSFQSVKTKKIIASSTLQTRFGKGSAPLELQGFQNCLEDLTSSGTAVKTVTTDRNKQVAKWIRENKPLISHKYDPWHFAKNVTSKLRPLAKKKESKILEEWIKPVGNHLFYCSENCDGDSEKMLQMWKSLLYHVTNRHKFAALKKYPKCAHPPYLKRQVRKKKWLKKNSVPYNELEKVAMDAKILADVPQLANADHTGHLESFHSMLLAYAPKRLEFDNANMKARVQLAIMDFNENVSRQQALIKKPSKKSGALGERRFRYVCSRRTREWVAKEEKEQKTTKFVDNLFEEIFKLKESGAKLKAKAQKDESVPRNIAPTPRPAKEDILSRNKKFCRFK